MIKKFLLPLILILFTSVSNIAQNYPFFGVQTHFGQIERSDMDSASVVTMLDSISAAGIKIIRDEMYWSYIETTPGIYSFNPKFDFYVEQAHLRGISILLILNYNNPLYAPHAGSGITSDTNRIKFVEYCKKVVQRYAPRGIKLYEIWNEPNIPQFWDPTPSASAYKSLLQAVYPAIKAIDSTITVLGCATSPAEGNPAPYISWINFISMVMNSGGGAFMDAVSFHQYRVDKAPETYLFTDLNNLKAIIPENRNIFLTEIGYPTSSVWPNVSPLKQAEYLARIYLLGRNFPRLKLISWYDFKNDGESSTNNEHNFGIVNFNFTPKPAYKYYKTLICETGDKPLLSTTATGNFYKYIFGDSSNKTTAFWNASLDQQKNELFGSGIIKITHSDGTTYYRFDKDRILPVIYPTSPVYYSELTVLPALYNYHIVPENDSLIPGQKIQLGFRAMVSGSGELMYVDSTLVNWTVLDSTGRIDSLGKFYALVPGICRVKGEVNGIQVIKTFYILASYIYRELENFSTLANLHVSYFGMHPETATAITDTAYSSPPSALRIDYRFTYAGIDKHRVYFDCNFPLVGEPDSILIDIYNNGNGHVFGFQLEDADGQLFTVNTNSTFLQQVFGWKTIRASLKSFGSAFNHPAKLKRFIFYAVKSGGIVDSVYSGSVVIDNLRIHNGIVSDTQERGYETVTPTDDFLVFPNYPNPFNPVTKLQFYTKKSMEVSLVVYNTTGEVVYRKENTIVQEGKNEIEISLTDKASGVYYYVLITTRNNIVHGKMILLR